MPLSRKRSGQKRSSTHKKRSTFRQPTGNGGIFQHFKEQPAKIIFPITVTVTEEQFKNLSSEQQQILRKLIKELSQAQPAQAQPAQLDEATKRRILLRAKNEWAKNHFDDLQIYQTMVETWYKFLVSQKERDYLQKVVIQHVLDTREKYPYEATREMDSIEGDLLRFANDIANGHYKRIVADEDATIIMNYIREICYALKDKKKYIEKVFEDVLDTYYESLER